MTASGRSGGPGRGVQLGFTTGPSEAEPAWRAGRLVGKDAERSSYIYKKAPISCSVKYVDYDTGGHGFRPPPPGPLAPDDLR
jgi:hypothetical protein